MTIRLYILPIIVFSGQRGPKYIGGWPAGPAKAPGIVCPWSMIDYGSINEGIVAADVQPADHDSLVLNADVYAFPANIDAAMPQGEQSALTSFLEGVMVPAQWLAGQQTYRSVLRTIGGMFQYAQAFLTLLGYPADAFAGMTLSTQFRNLPAEYQAAAQQAAVNLGYAWNVSGNTTVRVLLKNMADQWGAKPIRIGIMTL